MSTHPAFAERGEIWHTCNLLFHAKFHFDHYTYYHQCTAKKRDFDQILKYWKLLYPLFLANHGQIWHARVNEWCTLLRQIAAWLLCTFALVGWNTAKVLQFWPNFEILVFLYLPAFTNQGQIWHAKVIDWGKVLSPIDTKTGHFRMFFTANLLA